MRACEYLCVRARVYLYLTAKVSALRYTQRYRPQLVCVAFAANLCVNKHESRCINAHTKANSAVPPVPLSTSLRPLSLLLFLPRVFAKQAHNIDMDLNIRICSRYAEISTATTTAATPTTASSLCGMPQTASAHTAVAPFLL